MKKQSDSLKTEENEYRPLDPEFFVVNEHNRTSNPKPEGEEKRKPAIIAFFRQFGLHRFVSFATASLFLICATYYLLEHDSSQLTYSEADSSAYETASPASSQITALPPTLPSEQSSSSDSSVKSDSFTVIFNLNGGRVGNSTLSIVIDAVPGKSVVPPVDVLRDGYTFGGWTIDGSPASDSRFDSILADMTAYAVWHPGGMLTTEVGPTMVWKYRWHNDRFLPFADILWDSGVDGAYLVWQLCDEDGQSLTEPLPIESNGGTIQQTDYQFDVTSPLGGALYPKGYLLRITPYLPTGTSVTTLTPVTMELPYFEATAQNEDGTITPVIFTNIGLYFHHSYESLTITNVDNSLHITGKLLPQEGEQIPLNIDCITNPPS